MKRHLRFEVFYCTFVPTLSWQIKNHWRVVTRKLGENGVSISPVVVRAAKDCVHALLPIIHSYLLRSIYMCVLFLGENYAIRRAEHLPVVPTLGNVY